MCADFVSPSPSFAPPPDVLGAYLRGQMAPIQAQAGMQQLAMNQQAMQQSAQRFPLDLAQLRMALQFQQMRMSMGQDVTDALMGGDGGQGGAQSQAGPTGGIQTGPQGSVGAPTDSSMPNGALSPSGSYTGAVNNQTGQYNPSDILTNRGVLAKAAGYQAAISGNPLDAIAKYNEAQTAAMNDRLQRIKINSAPGELAANQLLTSPNPAALLERNPTLNAGWQRYASRIMGPDGKPLDPFDPAAKAGPQGALNIKTAAALFMNDSRAQYGGEAVPMPYNVRLVRGANGQLLAVNDVQHGEATQVVPEKVPGYSRESLGYEPGTDTERYGLVQTAPGGSPAPIGTAGPGRMPARLQPVSAPGTTPAAPSGGLGSQVGPTTSQYSQPTPQNYAAAQQASSYSQGLQTVRGVEATGYRMPLADRTVMFKLASSDDPKAVDEWAKQWVSKQLDPRAATYIAGALPMIDALSHEEGGQRLSPAAIRLNLGSTFPIDPRNATETSQVEKQREIRGNSMISAAGPVIHQPQYAQLKPTPFVASDADYVKLDSGTRFIGPDGKIRRKP